MKDGPLHGYDWTQWWGVDSRRVVTAAKFDPYITQEIVIGHCTTPLGHHAWFVGLMVMFQKIASFLGLR